MRAGPGGCSEIREKRIKIIGENQQDFVTNWIWSREISKMTDYYVR